MSSLIELRNISMVFKKRGSMLGGERSFHVLNNINLSIHEGEVLALVGESGCGKTTMGKIITGLMRPTEGELLFQGDNIYRRFNDGLDDYRMSVQFIQQDSYAALNPVKTIRHSMAAPLKAHRKGMTNEQVEARIVELLEMVGLVPAEQFMEKYPHQMSGGQRQRVLIARALTMNPKLIVADEPVSMIDVSMRLSILNLMVELNRKLNIAFVYITHDLATARYIAHRGRICVMYLGEIMELSDLGELLTNPKHPYTQALISAIPEPDPERAREAISLPLKSMEIMSLENRGVGCPFHSRCLYGADRCVQDWVNYVEIDGAFVKCCNMEKVTKWRQSR